MTIYHGSDIPIKDPKIVTSNRLLDFGEGFYTTSSLEQAQRWAKRVKDRNNSKEQIVSLYEFDAGKAEKEIKIMFHNEKSLQYCKYLRCENIKEELNG